MEICIVIIQLCTPRRGYLYFLYKKLILHFIQTHIIKSEYTNVHIRFIHSIMFSPHTHFSHIKPSLDDDGTRLLTGFDGYDTQNVSYDSDSDSDTDSQESADDVLNQSTHLSNAHSLGKMVHHSQTSLIPIFDARRSRTLVIESRDRNLEHEHLFQFTIHFQPQTQHSQTDRIEKKALLIRNKQRLDLGNDSSYATHISTAQHAQFNTNNELQRRCTVLEKFEQVYSLTCQHAVFPRYPHMQCVGLSSSITNVNVNVPIDIRLHTAQTTLSGTGDVIRCCTSTCLPGNDGPLHIIYNPVNCKVNYATPLASLDALTVTVYTPDAPLHINPFDISSTPDMHHVTNIVIANNGEELHLRLASIPLKCHNPLNKGDIVSLRDFNWVNVDTLSNEQQQFRSFLYSIIAKIRLVVIEDVITSVVKLDLTKSKVNTEASTLEGIELGLEQIIANKTLLLNESMQYRLYIDVESMVRRLEQRTTVEAL